MPGWHCAAFGARARGRRLINPNSIHVTPDKRALSIQTRSLSLLFGRRCARGARNNTPAELLLNPVMDLFSGRASPFCLKLLQFTESAQNSGSTLRLLYMGPEKSPIV